MGQIIKSLASVCQSVCLYACRHSYGRNFGSYFDETWQSCLGREN